MWFNMHRHDHRWATRGGGRGPRGSGAFAFGGERAEAFGGRGRRRVFDGGELRLILLKLIADDPRHGYELIRTVEEISGGAYAPSPGVVYPTLSMLDEMTLIAEQRSDTSRKRFAITTEGQQHLADRHEQVAELFARLERMGGSHHPAGGSPVWRAMRNLGMAVRNQVGHGDVSRDSVHAIAEMIDDLAQRVERLK